MATNNWRQIDAPNQAGGINAFLNAGGRLAQGLSGVGQGVDQYAAGVLQQTQGRLAQQLAGATTQEEVAQITGAENLAATGEYDPNVVAGLAQQTNDRIANASSAASKQQLERDTLAQNTADDAEARQLGRDTLAANIANNDANRADATKRTDSVIALNNSQLDAAKRTADRYAVEQEAKSYSTAGSTFATTLTPENYSKSIADRTQAMLKEGVPLESVRSFQSGATEAYNMRISNSPAKADAEILGAQLKQDVASRVAAGTEATKSAYTSTTPNAKLLTGLADARAKITSKSDAISFISSVATSQSRSEIIDYLDAGAKAKIPLPMLALAAGNVPTSSSIPFVERSLFDRDQALKDARQLLTSVQSGSIATNTALRDTNTQQLSILGQQADAAADRLATAVNATGVGGTTAEVAKHRKAYEQAIEKLDSYTKAIQKQSLSISAPLTRTDVETRVKARALSRRPANR